MAEARQDRIEASGNESERTRVGDLEVDLRETHRRRPLRGEMHCFFCEVNPYDGAETTDGRRCHNSRDPGAAPNVEDPLVRSYAREFDETLGDWRMVRCYVRVVRASHAAVLFDE